jgi:multiple antibiotic resistance protein
VIELGLRAFLTLLVVVDPVGIAPVFLALAGGRPKPEQARIARRAVVVGGGVLFFFAVGGPWLLGKLGISMDAFRIAGVSIFPLAIPLIAGPGAMASTMILVGQAGSDPRRLAAVFAMAAAVLALTWLALRLAAPLGRVLRRTGVNVVTRVLGVLLAALAVQYVADGIRGLLRAG